MFSDGVREQISADFRDWDMVQRNRVGDAAGRSHRFFFQRSFGPSAVQWSGIQPAGDFPTSQQVSVSENEAFFKEINATIEIEYNLWARARKTPEKYAEPLAVEIQSKATSTKRRMSADLFGDGSGVLGVVSSAAAATVLDENGNACVAITLASTDTALTTSGYKVAGGTIGRFEFDDIFQVKSQAGVAALAQTAGGNDGDFFRVIAKDRTNNIVYAAVSKTLAEAYAKTSYACLGAGTLASPMVIFRAPQPTGGVNALDLTALTSASDWNTISEVMAGLESLLAADGRKIHGITMSGSTAGTRFDCNAQPLDTSMIQSGLSLVKTIAGRGAYSWQQLLMAPEALDALITSRETDRRFVQANDGVRGVKGLHYLHESDSLEMYTTEFCPKGRIYALPMSKASKGKVLELFGSDFEPVKPAGQGSEFMLLPSTSGGNHSRMIRTYLFGVFALICKHPASTLTLHNFVGV